MNEVYVSYNGTLYVPYIAVYVYWDVICCLHERITEGGLPVLTSVLGRRPTQYWACAVVIPRASSTFSLD